MWIKSTPCSIDNSALVSSYSYLLNLVSIMGTYPVASATASNRRYQRQVQYVLGLTLGLNVLVVVIKVYLGFLTGSLSLLADALHSSTDSASNILGLISIRLSSPEPDEEHPYGHSKFEAIGALGIAAFLGIACLEIVQVAVSRLLGEAPDLVIDAITLQGMIVVLMINIGVAVYEHRRGQTLGSRILLADARHTFSDIWVTLVVLGGLLGVNFGWPWLDQVMALPIAGLVIYSAWKVLQENIPFLTDTVAIPPEALRKLAMRVSGVLDCHEITSRGIIGQMVFIEMHMVVEPMDIEAAHHITEEVEQLIQEHYGMVKVTIHLEPYDYIES